MEVNKLASRAFCSGLITIEPHAAIFQSKSVFFFAGISGPIQNSSVLAAAIMKMAVRIMMS